MAVVALAVHPPSIAATRLRAQQFGPALAEAGIELRLWSFFDDRELRRWYGPTQRGRVLAVVSALLRLPLLLRAVRGTSVAIVIREMLPIGPPILERLVARGRRLVWDVDDAVWTPYVSPTAGRVPRWLRAPADKYGDLCRRADEVWAGSEVLATWCRARNDHVRITPTVVDVPAERPTRPLTRVAGWIGSHSTGEFIEGLLPAMAGVDPPTTVIVVGARPAVPPGVDCEVREWTPAAERRALEEIRVGLYPIDRSHPLAEGKCGLKAILFMAEGTPVVTTPTTTNAAIVRDGVDGFHAQSDAEWAAAVSKLLDDPDLWESCSRSAHARARTEFSVQTWAPRVVERVAALAAR